MRKENYRKKDEYRRIKHSNSQFSVLKLKAAKFKEDYHQQSD